MVLLHSSSRHSILNIQLFAMDLEPYQWRQTDAGAYERLMDGIERLWLLQLQEYH